MRTVLLGLVLSASACVTNPDGSVSVIGATPNKAGTASMSTLPDFTWLQGEPSTVYLGWAYTCHDVSLFCPASTFTVLDVHCDGCTVTDAPVAEPDEANTVQTFHAVATTDDKISLTATLRFDPDGTTTTVSATVDGDHETAVEAECVLLDANAYAALAKDAPIPTSLLRDCATPRQPDDLVGLFSKLHTLRGQTRYPAHAALTIKPAPMAWRIPTADSSFTGELAILPALPDAATKVTLSARLLPTGTSTASFDIAAVVSQ